MIKLIRVNLDIFEVHNKIINFVKAKYDIKNKPDAINFIIEEGVIIMKLKNK